MHWFWWEYFADKKGLKKRNMRTNFGKSIFKKNVLYKMFTPYIPGLQNIVTNHLAQWTTWLPNSCCRPYKKVTLIRHQAKVEMRIWTHWPLGDVTVISNYRQVSNIRRTKSQHLKDSRTVLWLSLPNPLKPDIKSRMKMLLEQRRQAVLQLHLSDRQFYSLLRCVLY